MVSIELNGLTRSKAKLLEQKTDHSQHSKTGI